MAKLGHRSVGGQHFVHGATNSVYGSYLGHQTLGLSSKDQSKSICHFNCDLNPVCKTYSWNLFEVNKNDLKKCVLEMAALLQSQRKVKSALLGQSTGSQILLHALYRTLGYHYVGTFRILFSLVFHCWGISPKYPAHQTRYSVLVSLSHIFLYHVCGLLSFACFHTDLSESSPP